MSIEKAQKLEDEGVIEPQSSGLKAWHFLLAAAIVVVAAIILLWFGRSTICTCGFVRLWHGDVFSSENSQHISDWYSPSHFIHGILFFGALTWLFRTMSLGLRFNLAVLIEAIWEVFENTDFVINRYREATIALDYFGDSVLNSTSDILFMMIGFFVAWRLPVWVSLGLVISLEIIAALAIRDNLTLNIIMLIYPFDAIKLWQLG